MLEARNAGKPIGDARGEIAMVVECFRYYAAAPERLLGQTIPVAGGVDMTFREPLGVVGLIVPWNFPLVITSWKTAPALAAGNTVVLKPAELTPLTAIELERIALEAGHPGGRAQRRRRTRLGLRAAPRRASRRRQDRLHRLDRGRARASPPARPRRSSGSRSSSAASRRTSSSPTPTSRPPPQRLRSRSSATPARTAARARGSSSSARRSTTSWPPSSATVKSMVVGDPLDEATEMGPLISASHRETVALVPRRRGPGRVPRRRPRRSRLLVPADRPRADRPTTTAPPARRSSGRSPRVIPFDGEAEAVALANDTIYGLSGSIWSGDGGRALRVARALETGVISINSNSSVRVATPFGGFKQSGVGRELGPDALEHYTDVKNVFYATS